MDKRVEAVATPQSLFEAYQLGLGDGMVYATAVMKDREPFRRKWLDQVQAMKRKLKGLDHG